MIKFENTQIGYRDVLFEISDMSLEASRLYILVGKNGAGKSTLFRTMVGEKPMIDGNISYNGTSIKKVDREFFSKTIAFVSSTFPRIDYLKVEDYIRLGRTPYTNALGRLNSNDHSSVSDAIQLLGIEHLTEKFTTEISDGERQLVAIARAVAQETPIILLDEPTAFLDYKNKSLLLKALVSIAEKKKKCIVLSSHDIDLSIESNQTFLILDQITQQLQVLTPPINKDEVIRSAFD